MKDTYLNALLTATELLNNEQITYCLIDTSALILHGVEDVPYPHSITISVQWDLFQKAYQIFVPYGVSEITKSPEYDCFDFTINELNINILCYYNTVIETDPDRMNVNYHGLIIWVKSFDYFLKNLPANDVHFQAIKNHLQSIQQKNSQLNKRAWNNEAYTACLNKYGTPDKAADKLKRDPKLRIRSIYKHLENLQGKSVINLLGSHGAKAISMALLGARATVVDISKENERYALEVAQAAEVELNYIVSDVLHMPSEIFAEKYDIVLMELGVLHYFIDLEPLAKVISNLLQVGGRVIIQDFHPISTKLITSKGKKHKVTGNYFDKSIEVQNVAFSKHLDFDKQQTLDKVHLRRWTLGEIVTAIAQSGLFIRVLEEEPNTKIDDIGLPKTFTIVAEKI
ncbi:class I SAM-dependent methyltransferase [Bacillus sp. CGMCC 1.16607]|uniref:class I SAM-dependent methyltransferase n=1 Tax=Bacillus sp. CGMCC 1.16607 TaxID=3351842 RepID=UPI0036438181